MTDSSGFAKIATHGLDATEAQTRHWALLQTQSFERYGIGLTKLSIRFGSGEVLADPTLTSGYRSGLESTYKIATSASSVPKLAERSLPLASKNGPDKHKNEQKDRSSDATNTAKRHRYISSRRSIKH
jgi:hypothetical protein